MRRLLLTACLLAACGDDGATRHDAGDDGGGGSDDGDIDADPNVRGPVTVVIVDKNDRPLPDMHVVFIDTDATVTDLVTDAAGTAVGNVFPGASVTAIRASGTGQGFGLTTVQQLVPNDTITLISAPSAVSSSQDPFVQRLVPMPSADIASATKSGSTATYTTQAPHGFAVGDEVVVAGSMVSGYNGTRTVASVPTPTTFTADLGGGGLAASTDGTAYKGVALTVTYPTYGGATSYDVHTPCGPVDVGTSTSPTLTLNVACATSPMDITVFAKTSSTVEAAYAQVTGAAFSPGGTIAITDTFHAVSTLTASYTNTTTRVTDIELERYSPYVRGLAQATTAGTVSGGMLMLTASVGTPPNAWIHTQIDCDDVSSSDCISSGTGAASQTITQKVDGTQTSYALDLGANLLPWVNASYDPPTTTLQITVTGTGTYDLYEANLRYVRGGTFIYTWRVFGPLAQPITFPALPSTLPGDPTIRPTDTQSAYQVYLCETDAVNGYRDAIKNPYLTLQTCESPSTPTVRPAGGTLNRRSSWN